MGDLAEGHWSLVEFFETSLRQELRDLDVGVFAHVVRLEGARHLQLKWTTYVAGSVLCASRHVHR